MFPPVLTSGHQWEDEKPGREFLHVNDRFRSAGPGVIRVIPAGVQDACRLSSPPPGGDSFLRKFLRYRIIRNT
jgi:hypothetical protein